MFGLTGWKTIAAGVGAILTGAGTVVAGLLACFGGEGSCDMEQINGGWQMVLGGLAVIGIGHKVQKGGTGS